MKTVNQLLVEAAANEASGLRFVDRKGNEQWHSWCDVQRAAVKVAAGLRDRGLMNGQTVALFYPTCDQFFSAFFGALLAGGIPVPMFSPVTFGQISPAGKRTLSMLKAAEVAQVLVHDSIQKPLLQFVMQAGYAAATIEQSAVADESPSLDVSVELDDLSLIQFSSGTTVSPKPIALSHRAIVAQTTILNRMWPPIEGRRHTGVTWLPLYHDMGLVGCVFPNLLAQSELTLLAPETFALRPAMWLQTISRYQGTISPAPSFGYRWCVDRIKDAELEGVDLSCWKVALNGAESVSANIVRKFIERFEPYGFNPRAMTPVYGLAEASLAVTFSNVEQPFTSGRFCRDELQCNQQAVPVKTNEDGLEIVSVGRPVPGFELEIRDDSNQPLPEQQIGVVWARGPSLMQGYYRNESATASTLVDGWLCTGDLGFLHDGNLYITGRQKDILVVRGRNHAPEEVESAVEVVQGVRAGCWAAVGHLAANEDHEEVWLLVEHERMVKPDRHAEIIASCRREVLATTGIDLDRVVLLPPGTIPKTSSGKIRRRAALDEYLAAQRTDSTK